MHHYVPSILIYNIKHSNMIRVFVCIINKLADIQRYYFLEWIYYFRSVFLAVLKQFDPFNLLLIMLESK